VADLPVPLVPLQQLPLVLPSQVRVPARP